MITFDQLKEIWNKAEYYISPHGAEYLTACIFLYIIMLIAKQKKIINCSTSVAFVFSFSLPYALLYIFLLFKYGIAVFLFISMPIFIVTSLVSIEKIISNPKSKIYLSMVMVLGAHVIEFMLAHDWKIISRNLE